MKVRELIQKLAEFPPDLDVAIEVDIIGAGQALVPITGMERKNDNLYPSPRLELACDSIHVTATLEINED